MVDAPHTGSTVGVHKLWGRPSAIRRVLPPPPAGQAPPPPAEPPAPREDVNTNPDPFKPIE
jgi:hypothetical protein